ncbi:DUF443 family protein [Staphylococcus argensis]|uniref:DUF443 family protein n=1 Tax=Staphylococcus argensis TaxID=1607738 RepID=UPI0021B31F3B|nr:DUF443 family protein [Staphylococcus argensis]MCY6991645.1 DUF443 family protein [Staphylococcus argensis]
MEKNSKYKLIELENRYFVIDLNRNKLTFLFPLLNYFTRQKLIEISEEELHYIKESNLSKERVKKSELFASLGTGIGIFLAFLTKSVIDYMDFSTNFLLNIIIVLITIASLIIIKGLVNRNKEKKIGIDLSEYKYKCFIYPDKRTMIKNILLNIFFSFLFIATTIGTLPLKESSYLFIFGIIVLLSFILFQNGILYNYYKTEGMRGRLIRNNK